MGAKENRQSRYSPVTSGAGPCRWFTFTDTARGSEGEGNTQDKLGASLDLSDF